MCMIDDAEPIYPKRITQPKARKEHKCCECGRPIEIGERHEHVSGICDRRMFSERTCEGCQWAREWLDESCGGFCYTIVLEELKEHRREGYADNLLMLRIRGMERKWPAGYLEKCKAKEAARRQQKSASA